ncbi:hypothetical protein E1A91_D11G186200v1 [Gossypium mustelinum]|uniref:Uncharacterized protein n=1 Tax=Gossypium mustelinum TaxID=34275 RepID=A0A5D2ST12_GOSMU|nr:hypothetical protein E1A91_D11G186200v1 [Gossypium mustelinum]
MKLKTELQRKVDLRRDRLSACCSIERISIYDSKNH